MVIGNRVNSFHRSLEKNKTLAVSSKQVKLRHLDSDMPDIVAQGPASCTITAACGLNGRAEMLFWGALESPHVVMVRSIALLDADGLVLYEANLEAPVQMASKVPMHFEMQISI